MGQVEKINNNHHDTLKTAVQKLGLELTSTKEKEGSSAARENSGGGKGNLQETYFPSRLELKRLEEGKEGVSCDNVRGMAINANEIYDLVARVVANVLLNVQGRFD